MMHEEGHYTVPDVAEGRRSLFLTMVTSGSPNETLSNAQLMPGYS